MGEVVAAAIGSPASVWRTTIVLEKRRWAQHPIWIAWKRRQERKFTRQRYPVLVYVSKLPRTPFLDAQEWATRPNRISQPPAVTGAFSCPSVQNLDWPPRKERFSSKCIKGTFPRFIAPRSGGDPADRERQLGPRRAWRTHSLVKIQTSIAKIRSDPDRVRQRSFRRRLVEAGAKRLAGEQPHRIQMGR